MQDERAVVNEGDAMHAQPARSALRSVLLGLGAGLGERAVDGVGGERHDHGEGRVVLGIVASVWLVGESVLRSKLHAQVSRYM